MNNLDSNKIIWERSRALSHAYWAQYHRLIKRKDTIAIETSAHSDCDETQESECTDTGACYYDESELETDPEIAIDLDLQDEESEVEEELDEGVNSEYLEFIKITRQHQAERDKLKQLELRKRPDLNVEEYYKDISQVNTLVEDNLVIAPKRNDTKQLSNAKQQEEKLIELYGGREAYERIRSMEMSIDEHFNMKFQELTPRYWPVMPLNPKPYLNPIRSDP